MYKLLILLSILKNVAAGLTTEETTCNTNNKYPVGLGKSNSYKLSFDVMDFFLDASSSLTYVAVGASCNDDTICKERDSKQQPLIRLYKDSTREKVWSKYFKFSKSQTIKSIAFYKSTAFLS